MSDKFTYDYKFNVTDSTSATVAGSRWLGSAYGFTPQPVYEARFTPTSGTLSGGTASTWQTINSLSTSNAEWYVEQSTTGTHTCTGTVEIRRKGTTTVLATASFTLTATRT